MGESSARIVLEHSGTVAGKRHRDNEMTQTDKRLKKEDDKITRSQKDVLVVRGLAKEEIEVILAMPPDRSMVYSED